MEEKRPDNSKAIAAGKSKDEKERFLSQEQGHILHLTARIMKRTITDSDDEYSIALIAVSDANLVISEFPHIINFT